MADCSGCSQEKSCNKKSCVIETNKHPLSNVKHLIGIMSGKGGVGKSSVTSMLAVWLQRKGYKVGVLDADITGPSIPKMFGVKGKPTSASPGMYPISSQNQIKIMSINLLLEEETKPVIWRGPVISGTVKQFWTDVAWGDLDYLLIDMPPGTGDVPLTVMQVLPLTAVVIVSTPQNLVSMVVEKSIHMANTMKTPILGLIENMSYAFCPHCNEKHYVFGEGKIKKLSHEYKIPFLGDLPIDASLTKYCDDGKIEKYENEDFSYVTENILKNISLLPLKI